jgi:hypothetical protein
MFGEDAVHVDGDPELDGGIEEREGVRVEER